MAGVHRPLRQRVLKLPQSPDPVALPVAVPMQDIPVQGLLARLLHLLELQTC